ncbi:MAG: NTP transferase domain-containing protein [Pseudomonadota bacterium]
MIPKPLFEHPEDVLCQWFEWRQTGDAALVVVTSTEGGSVRAPGAMMAISHDGKRAGYVSGGCIDEDVTLHAVGAICSGNALSLRYGKGSPFKDLPLPCGGAIEIAIFPQADQFAIKRCLDELTARKPSTLELKADSVCTEHTYFPKLRVRIAGRGADALALWRFCKAVGFPTELAIPGSDPAPLEDSQSNASWLYLSTPSSLPERQDDPWTAFILMFHDLEWEVPLLQQALNGPAFYIGAVGSQLAQQKRRKALRDAGANTDEIERIRGPVGLIPSLREASMLAVSTLAEIVEAYEISKLPQFNKTGLALLAAGLSTRFEDGDKLLAEINGKPLIEHSATILSDEKVAMRLGVVGSSDHERRRILSNLGWSTVNNYQPELGLGRSIAAAVKEIDANPDAEAAIILLADMPNIPKSHLLDMRRAMTPDIEAVITRVDDFVCPPAIFSRSLFPKLMDLTSDKGARHIFQSLAKTCIVDLGAEWAQDVDRIEDIAELKCG